MYFASQHSLCSPHSATLPLPPLSRYCHHEHSQPNAMIRVNIT
ncbi:unnamed protein product [Phytomonas sp. EM1]|nr:unnamed protein product [Phytomonas sp. EM1]|eukprot:CCW59660.1 unnamed protein product [Phytomonas sp. isolate EM1]